jgi:hypothetical protein
MRIDYKIAEKISAILCGKHYRRCLEMISLTPDAWRRAAPADADWTNPTADALEPSRTCPEVVPALCL